MNPLLIGPIADLVKTIVGKIWPDPAKQQEAALALMELQQKGELAELDAQIKFATAQSDINKTEAANPSLFVSGWRPFIGWICGLGLATQFLIFPVIGAVSKIFGKDLPLPPLDLGTLMTLLFGMLGLGAMRTTEKIQGVTK